MWTPKWCLKSGPRFGAREKKKQFGGPENGVQILHPILGSTLPIIFREVMPEKSHFEKNACEQVRCLDSPGTGEDLVSGMSQ